MHKKIRLIPRIEVVLYLMIVEDFFISLIRDVYNRLFAQLP